MRTTIRLSVFAATVSLIAVLVAPVRADNDAAKGASASAAVPASAGPAGPGPAEEDLLGTWTGTILPQGSADALDGGIISISRGIAGFAVTVGPNARVRFSSKRVARTEQGLSFEVWLPGDETRLLVYELNVDGPSMTGNVTFVRHGVTEPASVAFVRQ